ncbi:hypothetical protein EDB83DRAFT_2584877 [Lactarius deliciosus]|nr:hypothetical protein EDB83DRAFT_2584877 [Lactarius deliciosus]
MPPPSPLSAPPIRAKRGRTMARRCLSPLPPASPFPRPRRHVRAEGGHTRVTAHPPLPSPRIDRRRPVRTEMRGATAGHNTTPPLHVAPAPSPSPPSRVPPSPPLAQTGTQEGRPRTQEGGQRAHPSLPWRGRCQSNPTPPTHTRRRRAHPVSSARATPTPPHAHHTAPPVHARGGVQPLRAGYAGPVFTRPATPADAGGSVRPAQPPPHEVRYPSPPVYAPHPGGGAF